MSLLTLALGQGALSLQQLNVAEMRMDLKLRKSSIKRLRRKYYEKFNLSYFN